MITSTRPASWELQQSGTFFTLPFSWHIKTIFDQSNWKKEIHYELYLARDMCSRCCRYRGTRCRHSCTSICWGKRTLFKKFYLARFTDFQNCWIYPNIWHLNIKNWFYAVLLPIRRSLLWVDALVDGVVENKAVSTAQLYRVHPKLAVDVLPEYQR